MDLSTKKLIIILLYIFYCVAAPISRGSTDIGAMCTVVIGGVMANCVINNSCNARTVCGAVVGGFSCWLLGRAENYWDFKIQNSLNNNNNKII
ncbi:hypothetical protein BJ944DRAFT_268346 [Cunninghamella echinulata]|nr:hypothetical protein BJ944DRAFT_268346 [Cunninghamella echinulata]